MPYPQDLKGKFVRYTIDVGAVKTDAHNALLVDGLLTGQTANASANVYAVPQVAPVIGGHRPPPAAARPAMGGHRAAAPGQPVNTGNNWNFTFLKYMAGATTTAPLGTGVLTGPMSGCFLCTYLQGGARSLAHIGTANATNSFASVNAKNAWSAFVARPDVSEVVGASPADYFNMAENQAATNAAIGGQVAGFFTAAGLAYAMLFKLYSAAQSPLVPAAAVLEVIDVKPMNLQPWSTIAALRTFQPVVADLDPAPKTRGAFKLPSR